jgi:HK97 family phage prohead protease
MKLGNVKKFQTTALMTPNIKAAIPVEENGRIVDYLDVETEGYASTFAKVTPEDRYGDYILPGAFSKTLAAYNKNPMVLRDHINSTDHAAGISTMHFEDERGLFVRNKISNAPGLRDFRFKVAEGIIKTYSIGGFFYYLEDMRGIFEIDLFEYSFVAIPANPDALFNVRNLDLVEFERLINTSPKNVLENIEQSIKSGNVVDAKNLQQASRILNKAYAGKTAERQTEPPKPGVSVGGIRILGG